MTPPPLFTRRSSLAVGLGGLVLPSVLGARVAAADAPTFGPQVHGLSVFGDLALPVDFPHLPYADPKAPKGGEISLQPNSAVGNQNGQTFNTLNIFNPNGDGAAGVDLTFDSLMTGSNDEPDALYGLVAKAVQVSPDKLAYRFLLRKEARFFDGSPITARDVVFSLNILRDKGHTSFSFPLQDLDGATAEADDVVVIKLKPTHSRGAILFIAGTPILSAAYYASHPFDEVTQEAPLGSGAYKVGAFLQGKHITMERNADYWAKDLPINVGVNNFGAIRFEYYADRSIAFEGFKAGDFTFHEEAKAARWATGYDIPPVADGRIKKEFLPDDYPNGTQGWFFNTRRDKFKDPRVREAIGYAFDFKWTNANIMYNAYARTISYFQNSPMAATGTPSPEELALLEPFRDKLPTAVFGPVFVPPDGDGSGTDRAMLRKGFELLKAAGCKRQGDALVLPDGQPLEIEFLYEEPAFEPHTLPFIHNLGLLGIKATTRVIDAASMRGRTDHFDFDIIVERFGFGLTPSGSGLRETFGSRAANIPSSRNLCGIADPVIDVLIEKAAVAADRPSLTVACSAMDRVLRAGHYWVPMWNKPGHTVAFWNLFSRPQQPPKYGMSVVSTWWYDEAKAKATDLRPR